MTRIVDGYAQPDIEAEREGEKVVVFVETPASLKENALALKKSLKWLEEHEPHTRVDFVHTVPRA